MNATAAVEWFRETLWTALMVAGPPVATIVMIGLVVAIVQAATQINDQAVAFAPKAIGAVAALALAGPWMIRQLVEFARTALVAIGDVGS